MLLRENVTQQLVYANAPANITPTPMALLVTDSRCTNLHAKIRTNAVKILYVIMAPVHAILTRKSTMKNLLVPTSPTVVTFMSQEIGALRKLEKSVQIITMNHHR